MSDQTAFDGDNGSRHMPTRDGSGNRRALSSSAVAPAKFRYTPCVQIGPIVQLSGMVALEPSTGRLVAGGPGAETMRILDNLRLAMPDYGLTLEELLIARIYTTKFEAFAEINSSWEAVFSAEVTPPARTAVGVIHLPLGATVEIEFTFVT